MTLPAPASRPRRSTTRKTAPAVPRLPSTASRQIARFAAVLRKDIRRIVRSHPRALDLLEVYPGVLYALAIGHGGYAAGEAALSAVESGAPLRSVADALALPMWLRRLPPEAFCGDLSGLPADEPFGRRIVPRLPQRPAEAADWLAAVRFASIAAGSEFALWVVRHRLHGGVASRADRLAVLSAYAWHSRHERSGRASELAWSRWRPEMAPDTAICAAKSWFNRLLLCARLPCDRSLDPWLEPGTVEGLEFVPLTDSAAVLEEARAMNNCTDQYAGALGFGRCRLFSVRRDGHHVATLEVVPHTRESGVLTIGQLKGPCNAPAPLTVWQPALRWLASQDRLLQSTYGARPLTSDAGIWHELWTPYRSACGGAPWIPASPEASALADIEGGLAALARDANIRSWLFV